MSFQNTISEDGLAVSYAAASTSLSFLLSDKSSMSQNLTETNS